MYDERIWSGNKRVAVHNREDCIGDSSDGFKTQFHCAIHNPSDHPLAAAPMRFHEKKGILYRVCVHGLQHPDPDDAFYRQFVNMDTRASAQVHRCDSCCKD